MKPELWEMMNVVFHHAVDLTETERRLYLQKIQNENPDVYQHVDGLLHYHFKETELSLEGDAETRLKQIVHATARILHQSEALVGTSQDLTHAQTSTLYESNEPNAVKPSSVTRDRAQAQKMLESLGELFEFREFLGSGAGGVVARVWDKSLHRTVALKILRRPESVGNARAAKRQLEREKSRLLSESRNLAKVRSDHIVQIFDVGESAGCTYLVMELIEGPSLRSQIKEHGALEPKAAAQLCYEVARGLQEAHQCGVVHRDIKPSNILLAPIADEGLPWRAKIIDFGIALNQEVEASENKGGSTLSNGIEGTPSYMAPELFGNAMHEGALFEGALFEGGPEIAPTSDVYALGATLYESLTGKVPYRGAVHMLIKQKSAPVTPPRELDDRIPPDLESVCLKALSFEPMHRYQTAREFADDLRRFLSGAPTVARPLSASQRLLRWSARHKALSVAAASIVVLLSLLSFGSVVVATVLWQKNLAIAEQRVRTQNALEARILTADPDSLLLAVEQFRNSAEQPVEQLRQLKSTHTDSRARFNTACALAILGESMQQEIVNLIPFVARNSHQCKAIAMALHADPEQSRSLISDAYDTAPMPEKIKLATLAWHVGDPSKLLPLADARQDADARTQLIHGLADWCPDLDQAIDQALNKSEPDLATCFMLGIGLMDNRLLSDRQRESLQAGVRSLVADKQCPSQLSAAALWVANSRFWLHKREGNVEELPFRMIKIGPGRFIMGESDPSLLYDLRAAHPVEITQPFLLADREVSVGFFRQVLIESDDPELQKLAAEWEPDEVISPTDEHPAQSVTWIEAVQFCNALSIRSGLQACYRLDGKLTLTPNGEEQEIENWVRMESADGYRLPTEAEWEFAARAGTSGFYSFGNDRHYLEYYGLWSNNLRIEANPGGKLMPNPWGLFDMHGNVWEWSDDWFCEFPNAPEIDPIRTQPTDEGKAYRGGGVATFSGDPTSSARGRTFPANRYTNTGFRVARSVKPSTPL
jgi:serine/threonine protein kinase/formylglycine-generating enzyme required for sulfatase activity